MEETEEAFSPEREALLRYKLDKKTLSYCQEKFAGEVQLLLVRRTRVVLKLKEHLVFYHLPTPDQGECSLITETSDHALWLLTDEPDLHELGKHIAAEAMLALRNGHKEYVRVKRRKKQITQADVP